MTTPTTSFSNYGQLLNSLGHHSEDCRINHRTYGAMARHVWRGIPGIDGEGRYAVVAFCYWCTRSPRGAVSLWPCLADARAYQAHLVHLGIGCVRDLWMDDRLLLAGCKDGHPVIDMETGRSRHLR